MAAGAVSATLTNPLAKRCASFDGVNDKITANAIPNVVTKDKDYSVSCFAYFRSTIDNTLINISNGANDSFILGYEGTANEICVGHYDGASYNSQGAGIGTLNTWYHIVITHNGSTKANKIYINGTDVTEAGDANVRGTVANTTFGTRTDGDRDWFDGALNNVRIYDRIITNEEIASLAIGVNLTKGLTNNWKLETDYNDSVGNNNGTNNGSVLTAIDDQVDSVVRNARVTANDKFFIKEVNGKILTTHIEEAA